MEKKKKTSERMSQGRFLSWWILAHVLGAGILAGVYYFVSQPMPRLYLPGWLNFSILVLIAGALPGFLFSVPQKWLMKRGFGLDVRWWRRASILACAIGFALYYWGIRSFSLGFALSFPLVLMALRYLAPILTQTLLLKRYIKRAWLWGLANIVSMIVFQQFIQSYTPDFFYWGMILLVPVQAAVTGLTLLWLYGMAQQDKVQKEESHDAAAIERLRDKLEDDDYTLENGTYSVSVASQE